MKIRYIFKHFVFRLSRAFYHARKFLAVFGLCLILLVSLFAMSVFAEATENHIFADNVGLFYSQSDMNMVGKPTDYLLLENVESGFYRMWYRFSTNTSFSDYRFQDIDYSSTLRSRIYDLNSVFGRATNGWTGAEIGIQSKYGNDTNLNHVFALNEILQNQRVSFAMDLYADWGFAKYDKCYAVLRCRDLFSDYELYYIIGWYDLSAYGTRTKLSLYFDFENHTGYALQPVGIYFYQVPTIGKSLGGTIGFGNVKYHVFTEEEKRLAQYNDAIDNQTEQIIGSLQGWNGQSKPPSGSDTVTDLDNAEQNLIAESSEGFNNFTDIMNGLSGRFETYASAFASVGNFFMDIAYIPFFTAILYISIAFGIFALIVNLALSLDKAGKGKERRQSKKSKGGGSS